MTTHTKPRLTLPRMPWWLAACLFAGIAVFFLWEEHQAHILGALPWLFLLACPLIHLLLHGGHRGHEHGEGGQSGQRDDHSHHQGGAS